MIARSRLRWFDAGDESGAIEIPHLRGTPILDASLDTRVVRRREWPNRLGVCESGAGADSVRWYPELAPPPPTGRITELGIDGQPRQPDGAGQHSASHAARTEWLRNLVRSASQHRGVSVAGRVRGPACVLLTPRGAPVPSPSAPTSVRSPWGLALGPVPAHLGEFPGGLQLAVTDIVWGRRDEYAAAVSDMITGGP